MPYCQVPQQSNAIAPSDCKQALGTKPLGIKEITDWLNCDMEDAGFQLFNEDEIIAEVRHSPKEDDEEDDESENDSQVKISNNDAFEYFSKGLAWLDQQEQCDSSELMLLRKFRDRAARQRMINLRQMKIPFKSFYINVLFKVAQELFWDGPINFELCQMMGTTAYGTPSPNSYHTRSLVESGNWSPPPR
ncbi:hypothetical protein AVEN_54384-1 [Araneus ventricosus]|uniref:Uncharacterized protein n=1 Tax=Araneus ventricosus TaxID=182803 RepID=A0A4Y2FUY2_ARAVE|nr:hypothetical protein AVEN_54384-1 [Araneus ventricosus]